MASRAEWVKRVSEYERSGQGQREFADACGVTIHSLRFWLYRLRREGRSPTMRLLPVRVSEKATGIAAVAVSAKPIEIVVGETTLRIMEGTSVEYVASLVDALRPGC